MSENKRLHPTAILFEIFNWVKSSLFLIIIFFITADFSYFLIGFLIFIFLFTISAVLKWYRYSYRVEEDALIIEYGVIKRTKRTISKHRIQSIDLTESVIHRLLKLVRVQIETATTGLQAEAQLPSVRLTEGYALRKQLKQTRTEEIEKEVNIDPQRKATNQELLLFGITSGGIGIILGSVGVLFSEIIEYVPNEIYDTTWEWFVASSILAIISLVAGLLLLIWVISVALTFIRYGKFTIKKQGEELLITRGILEKKQLTIPLGRIQAVGIEESIFRQPFDYVSVFAEIAGGSVNEQESNSAVLFPIMKKQEVQSFLDTYIPGMSWEADTEWIKAPRQAKKYYLFRSMIIPVIAIAILLYFYPSITWVAFLILPVAMLFGWLGYKDTGYSIRGNKLLLRYRLFKRITVQIAHRRIQAFEEKQHFIQRKDNVATISLSIISQLGGKKFTLKELETKDIDQLTEWYSTRKKSDSLRDNS